MLPSEDNTAASPLGPEQLLALAQTRALTRRLRLARGLALTNIVSLGGLALLSLAYGAFELSLSPMGVVLALLAWNEARGRSWLIDADRRAPVRLALNQLALLGAVLVYCAFRAYTTWSGPDPLEALTGESAELAATLEQLETETGQSLSELGGWARSVALLAYGAIAIASLIVQGLTAYYYHSLRATVDELARAPAWARALAL
jgi:hypothetical protein